MTHYDVLQVPPDASLVDIKKAYRRLALQWHPDRNSGTQESIAKFQEIGEAYSVLSVSNNRAAYDYDLRCGSQPPNVPQPQPQRRPSSSRPFVDSRCQYAHPPRKSRSRSPQVRTFDAFAQFDNLFRNDAFFHEAFKDMDDEFARRFSKQGQRGPTKRKEGWFGWLMRQCGIELNMTTIVSNGNGVTKSTYTSKRDSYEDKITKIYVDQQGRKIMKRSIEIDGNRIDDTYIDKKLVSRKVNGISEPVEKIIDHQANVPL
jgi:hypothetical protein